MTLYNKKLPEVMRIHKIITTLECIQIIFRALVLLFDDTETYYFNVYLSKVRCKVCQDFEELSLYQKALGLLFQKGIRIASWSLVVGSL